MSEKIPLGYSMNYTEESPTGGLRWLDEKGGRLQQEWLVIERRDGAAVTSKREWRDVPIVREPTP